MVFYIFQFYHRHRGALNKKFILLKDIGYKIWILRTQYLQVYCSLTMIIKPGIKKIIYRIASIYLIDSSIL